MKIIRKDKSEFSIATSLNVLNEHTITYTDYVFLKKQQILTINKNRYMNEK